MLLSNPLPLNDIQLKASEIAPLMCPGIAGSAAFKLAEAEKGDKLGLYGFGPTAHCVLKIAPLQPEGFKVEEEDEVAYILARAAILDSLSLASPSNSLSCNHLSFRSCAKTKMKTESL